MELFLPGVVPTECRRSHFQLVLPLKWTDEKYKPICMHFAGTGDHVRIDPCRCKNQFCLNFKFQLNLLHANHLLMYAHSFSGEGVISWPNQFWKRVTLALYCSRIHSTDWENPKIKCKRLNCSELLFDGFVSMHLSICLLQFRRSNLQHVSDIFVMGGCLVLESLVLFHFCERNGFGPLGVSGLSMGGHVCIIQNAFWTGQNQKKIGQHRISFVCFV